MVAGQKSEASFVSNIIENYFTIDNSLVLVIMYYVFFTFEGTTLAAFPCFQSLCLS